VIPLVNCLPAHRCGGIYGVLDGQGRPPRSNPVPAYLRAEIPDHHAFPQPTRKRLNACRFRCSHMSGDTTERRVLRS